MVYANLFHTFGVLFNNKNRKSYACLSLTLDLPIQKCTSGKYLRVNKKCISFKEVL